MSFDQHDVERLRDMAREHIWKIAGTDPATATEPIWFDGPRWDSLTWEDPALVDFNDILGSDSSDEGLPFIELDRVATEEVTIAGASYLGGMVGGESTLAAYRLGDDYWYVTQHEDAGNLTGVIGIVPDSMKDDVLRQLQLDWLSK